MKNFEEQWKHTLLRDTFKLIAETYWRLAYKSIRDEIGRLHNTQRPMSILEIVAFIDAELETGESK